MNDKNLKIDRRSHFEECYDPQIAVIDWSDELYISASESCMVDKVSEIYNVINPSVWRGWVKCKSYGILRICTTLSRTKIVLNNSQIVGLVNLLKFFCVKRSVYEFTLRIFKKVDGLYSSCDP